MPKGFDCGFGHAAESVMQQVSPAISDIVANQSGSGGKGGGGGGSCGSGDRGGGGGMGALFDPKKLAETVGNALEHENIYA
jgi:hypothetical protein